MFISNLDDGRIARDGKRPPLKWPTFTPPAGRFFFRRDRKGGSIPWLIELVTPFGAQEEVLVDLAKSIFTDKPFHYHMLENGQRIVKTYQTPTEH
ncbi:MAG: hypothetical protein ACPGVT_13155 [Maricaulaceae bacterium]